MSRHRRRVKKALRRIPSFSHGGTLQAGSLQAAAHAAAERFGLDWNIFNRQLIQESGYQERVGSSAGAFGVGQFMPATWTGVVNQHQDLAKEFGVTGNPADRGNGVASIYMAAAHMRDLLDTYGSYRNALIGYNAGPGAIGGPLVQETLTYLDVILGGGPEPTSTPVPANGASPQPQIDTGPSLLDQLLQGGASRLLGDGSSDPLGFEALDLESLNIESPGILARRQAASNDQSLPTGSLGSDERLASVEEEVRAALSGIGGAPDNTFGLRGLGTPLPGFNEGGTVSTALTPAELIPGVPAFHKGSVFHNIEHNPGFGGGERSSAPTDDDINIAIEWIRAKTGLNLTADQVDQFDDFGILDDLLRGSTTPSGEPFHFPFKAGTQEEFSLQQEIERGSLDVARGGLDVDEQLAGIQQQIADTQRQQVDNNGIIATMKLKLEAELGRGELQLARETERRLAEAQQQQFELQSQQFQLQQDQFRAEQEAGIAQQQIGLGVRGQDVTQRGQDINAQTTFNNQMLQGLQLQLQQAKQRGDFDQANAIEDRMRALQSGQFGLDQRGQDVSLRGQDLQSLLGQAQLGLSGLTSSAGILGDLASSRGNIAVQDRQNLARLAANPRDFIELQFALGNGESFLQNLLTGKPVGGQSAAGVGPRSALGTNFGQLVDQVTARPEDEFFQAALQQARRLGRPGQFGFDLPDQPGALQNPFDNLGQLPTQGDPLATPDLNFGLPDQLGAPGAELQFNPVQLQTYQKLIDAGVDPDVAANIARDPNAFRQFAQGAGGAAPSIPGIPGPGRADPGSFNRPFTQPTELEHATLTAISQGSGGNPIDVLKSQQQRLGLKPGDPLPPPDDPGLGPIPNVLPAFELPPANAHGGNLVIDEPTGAFGLESGELKFTLGERTTNFPQGIPETVNITPLGEPGALLPQFAHGGHASTPRPSVPKAGARSAQRPSVPKAAAAGPSANALPQFPPGDDLDPPPIPPGFGQEPPVPPVGTPQQFAAPTIVNVTPAQAQAPAPRGVVTQAPAAPAPPPLGPILGHVRDARQNQIAPIFDRFKNISAAPPPPPPPATSQQPGPPPQPEFIQAPGTGIGISGGGSLGNLIRNPAFVGTPGLPTTRLPFTGPTTPQQVPTGPPPDFSFGPGTVVPPFEFGPGEVQPVKTLPGGFPTIGQPTQPGGTPYIPGPGDLFPIGGIGTAPGLPFPVRPPPPPPAPVQVTPINSPGTPYIPGPGDLFPPLLPGPDDGDDGDNGRGQPQVPPLLDILRGLTPRTYFNLLPSQREALAAVISALYGVPPADAFATLERSFASGVNPNRGFAANFYRGGQVLAGVPALAG